MKQTKTILSMLCAAALFAACSSTDELEPVVQAGEQTAEEAVGFDVYTRGSQQTRAGYVGEIDATAFQVTGFGVYAYVTSGTDYAAGKWDAKKTTAKPDFMANQHVTYSGGWTYSPVKYWPNQANTNGNGVDNLGGGSATNDGTNIDYVSFFAYAPYVDDTTLPYKEDAGYTAATAEAAINSTANTGIIWLPANNTTGDPKVVYRMAADPTNAVDLMYGVAARAYTVNETTGQQGKPVTAGMSFLDMTKEVVADKLNYRFQHALTKLAVNVDAYFDEVRDGSTPGTNDVDPNTRIVIESIVLKTAKLAVYGELNLNNSTANTPNWGTAPTDAIISTDADPTEKAKYYNAGDGYFLPIANGLKHVTLTTDDKYFAQQPLGVTKKKQSLLGYAVDGTTPASLMFVPNTEGDDGLDIVITYKVITRDARLEKGYNVTTNVIKQNIASVPFNPGYSTVFNLHLGMTTVKMDAVVSDWDGTDVHEIDLPANVGVASLTASGTITGFGLVTISSPTATLEDGTNPTITTADLYFTTDAEGHNVLPVTKYSTDYYIPGNFTGSARDIYVWYGGVAAASSISQSAITKDDDSGVKVTANITTGEGTGGDAGKVVADGGTVTLTVAYNAGIKEAYNSSYWTVKQSVGGGAATVASVISYDNTAKTFVVSVPANAADAASRTFTFSLKHKDGMEITAAAVTQLAGANYVTP